MDLTTLTEFLDSLRSQITLAAMTPRSQKFLAMHSVEEKKTFIQNYTREDLKKPTTITCMESLKKSSIDRDAIDCLVLGCENGGVYMVDGEALTVLRSVMLPATPVFLHTSGLYDVEYRLLVLCRNGCLYTIKSGLNNRRLLKRETMSVTKATVELNSQAVGMVKVGKNIVIGCMDRTLRAYSLKWCLTMPSAITTIGNMEYGPRNYSACLVALENQEVHVYQDVFVVDVLRYEDVVTGLKFGQFGREEGALVTVMRRGGLNVRMFKRTARLEERSTMAGAPIAQSQKLNIPKKTKIFVDQTIREREESQKIHQVFQREQFMLRLAVAKDYVQMLDAKLNPVTPVASTAAVAATQDHVKLSAQVQGFGPVFRLKMTVEATGSEPVVDLELTFFFNTRLYSVAEPIMPVLTLSRKCGEYEEWLEVGMVVPGLATTLSTTLKCLMPEKGLADDVKVFLAKEKTPEPLITAVISMPVSEISLVD